MYIIAKSLNNNIVMAQDANGRSCILTGAGIGFGQRPGMVVPAQKIQHIYFGLDKLQESWLPLLEQCSAEALEIAQITLQKAERQGKGHFPPTALITVSSHLTCAMERTRAHIPVSTMLQEAVMLMYPEEYRLGEEALALLQQKTNITIPTSEAALLALCLVDTANGGCSGHLAAAQKAAEDIFALVRQSCTIRRDAEPLEFIAYIKLRCWLVSSGKTHRSVVEIPAEMPEFLYRKIPGAKNCIEAVARYLAEKFQYTVQQEDILNFLLRLNKIV